MNAAIRGCALVFCLLVAACGGGGNNGGSSGSPPVPPTSESSSVTPSVSPALVGATALNISTFASLYDEQAPGTNLFVGNARGGVTGAVFGFTAGGDIVLAGFPVDGSPTLSSESTIEALARIGLSVEAPTLALGAMLEQVRAHPLYANAVALHQQDVLAGRNGLRNVSVAAGVRQIVEDVAATAVRSALYALQLPDNRLDPLVRTLVSAPRGTVLLTQWSPQFEVTNGSNAVLDVGYLGLDGVRRGTSLLDAGGSTAFSKLSPVQSVAFNLQANGAGNSFVAVENALGLVFGFLPGGCVTKLLDVAGPAVLNGLVENPTLKTTADVVISTLENGAGALKECGQEELAGRLLSKRAAFIADALLQLYSVKKLSDQLDDWRYFQTARPVGVCLNIFGTITNCVNSISLSTELPVLLPGVFKSVDIVFLNSLGQRTLENPADIKLLYPGAPEVAELTIEQSGLKSIETKKAGSQPVTVLDEATGKLLELLVEVDQPSVVQQRFDMVPGESATAKIVGKRTGLPLDRAAELLDVFSSNEAVATVRQVGDSYEVKALGPGNAMLRVTSLLKAVDGFAIPIEVSDEFAFEIRDYDQARHSTPYECNTVGASVFNAKSGTIDICRPLYDVNVRCVGAGCVPGRFFAATSNTPGTLTQDGCNSIPTSYQLLGPEDRAGGSVYQQGSPYWSSLVNGEWKRPWPSISLLGFQAAFALNNSLVFDPPGPSCQILTQTLNLEIKIYDTLRKEYRTVTRSLAVP